MGVLQATGSRAEQVGREERRAGLGSELWFWFLGPTSVCLADPVLSPSCWPRPCGCLRTEGPAPFCAGLLLPHTPHFRSPGPKSSGVGWCQVGLRAYWGAFGSLLFQPQKNPGARQWGHSLYRKGAPWPQFGATGMGGAQPFTLRPRHAGCLGPRGVGMGGGGSWGTGSRLCAKGG